MPREKTTLQRFTEGLIAPLGGFASGKVAGKLLRSTDAATANIAAATTGFLGFVGSCLTDPDSAAGKLSRTALTASSTAIGLLSEVEAAGGTLEGAERAKAQDQAESERERNTTSPPSMTADARQEVTAPAKAPAKPDPAP